MGKELVIKKEVVKISRSNKNNSIYCIIFILILLTIPSLLHGQISEECQLHNKLGNEYCDKEEFEKAIEEYKEAIRLCTDYVDAYYNLGVTYYHDLKDYQNAKYYFEKFLEYESDTPDAEQVRKWLISIEEDEDIILEGKNTNGICFINSLFK